MLIVPVDFCGAQTVLINKNIGEYINVSENRTATDGNYNEHKSQLCERETFVHEHEQSLLNRVGFVPQ